MELDLEIDLDKVLRDLDNKTEYIENKQQIALEKIGIIVEEQVIANIDFKRIIDTGKLKQSIHHFVEKDMVVVSDGVHYGVYNEYGTLQMRARPFMRPAPEQKKNEIKEILSDIMK